MSLVQTLLTPNLGQVLMMLALAFMLREAVAMYTDGVKAMKRRVTIRKLEGWRRLIVWIPHAIMLMVVVQLALLAYYMTIGYQVREHTCDNQSGPLKHNPSHLRFACQLGTTCQ